VVGVYLGAGDRHLALLAVEHMINGPIAVANTNIHVSPNGIALSRLMEAAAVPRATGFDGR
jgi:hypothetical protein